MSIYLNKQGSLKKINHIYHCTSKLIKGLDYEVHEWLGMICLRRSYTSYGWDGPSLNAGLHKSLEFTIDINTDTVYGIGAGAVNLLPNFKVGRYTLFYSKNCKMCFRWKNMGYQYRAFDDVPNTTAYKIKVTTSSIEVSGSKFSFAEKDNIDCTINASSGSINDSRFKDFIIDGINYYPVRLLHSIPADYDYNGIARNAGDCGLINSKTGKFYGSTSSANYGYFTVENEFVKSKLQALVPKKSATSVIFDYTVNQDITDFELIGYVDKYNYIACYQKGTEYLILSDDVIYAPEDCSNLFVFYFKLAVLQFNNFNTRAVRNMYQMIAATAIENIDVSMFSTTMVTNMYSMFSNNQKLKSINIDNFNTSKVPNFEGMFYQNLALETAHVNINTASATNLKGFFYYCNHLKTIYSNDWNTVNVTQDTYMFAYCAALVGGNGTTYNASKIGKEMAVVDEVIETTVDEETVETIKEGYFTKPE